MRLFRIFLIVAAGALAAQFCIGLIARAGEQPPVTSEDDAACRRQGAPGTPAYVDCRKALVEVEAREQQKAIIQEQKRRDFDRILGQGTGGFDESF